MENLIFNEIPIYALFLGTVVMSLVCIEGGRRVGLTLGAGGHESSSSIGSTVSATLGLLAFILAFTFGDASSRYTDRKQLVVEGANAIGTCYLRTDLLPADGRDQAQRLLREWVDLRLQPSKFERDHRTATLGRAKEIQAELWAIGVTQSQSQPTPMSALFLDSCNTVFDTHEERVNKGLVTRIPGPLWFVLYVVSMLAMMAVGYQSGADGSRRRVGTAILALAFATVLVTIADLDDSGRGFLRVNQYSMEQLQESLAR